MKAINKILISTVACATLASCGEDYFDIENAGIVSNETLEEIQASDPDAILEVVAPLVVGLNNYTCEFNASGQATESYPCHFDFGILGLFHCGDVMVDDIAFTTQGSGWFTYDYQLDYWDAQYVKPYVYWKIFYTIIQRANEIISKIDKNTENADLRAYRGMALAYRAMSHAYLAQMYQQTYVGNEDAPGVPIILTTLEEGNVEGRATLRQVYAQVEKDFKASFGYLEGWVRPNKTMIDEQVAKGLYARICLVTNNWDDAITYSKEAREGYPLFTESEVLSEDGSAFSNINASEWIWGADITAETSTAFASFFSFMCAFDEGYGGAAGNYQQIDRNLFDQMSATDIRRQLYVNPGETVTATYSDGSKVNLPTYTNLKFKKVNNWLADYVYMRASEMVLIEAEAKAQKGDQGGAATTLKELMALRDPSWNRSVATVDEVYKQRRLELWGEGFALFDHLRLKKGINRAYEGSNHLSTCRYTINAGSWYFLYQIPQMEIDNNAALSETDQNPEPTGSKFQ